MPITGIASGVTVVNIAFLLECRARLKCSADHLLSRFSPTERTTRLSPTSRALSHFICEIGGRGRRGLCVRASWYRR